MPLFVGGIQILMLWKSLIAHVFTLIISSLPTVLVDSNLTRD